MPLAQYQLDRLGDTAGIVRVALPQNERRIAGRLGDSDDSGRRPAVEHGHVLGKDHALGGLVESCQLEVPRPPLDIEELLAFDHEVRSQFDQGQHPTLPGAKPFDRLGVYRRGPTQVGGGILPTPRSGEVDQPACCETGHKALTRLFVELSPCLLADRRVLSKQVAHSCSPLSPPIPRDPSAALLRSSLSASGSISVTDSVVNRYVLRCRDRTGS